jgi:hypothetical protein
MIRQMKNVPAGTFPRKRMAVSCMPARLLRVLPFLSLSVAGVAQSQELEPRAYSPAPVGTRIALAGIGTSKGAFVIDPAQPIRDVEVDIGFALAGAGYVFGLWERQARVLVIAPYAEGDITAVSGGIPVSQELRGFVDPRIKFSIGLAGAPALTAAEFAQSPKRTSIGAGLTILPPLGQYDRTSLVNLGYNRWAFKPEIAVTHPAGPWTWEAIAGVWLYTDNEEYFPGDARRSQGSVGSLQGHVAYTFANRSWLALDATWFSGGRTEVDGVVSRDRQHNSRAGLTYSHPLGQRQSLKLSYSTGVSTQRAADYETVNLTWQWVWF